MLGGPDPEKPWTTAAWSRIRDCRDPLVRRCSGPPAMRTRQLRPGPGSPNARSIRFGRLGWSGTDADRWTHVADGRLAATGGAATFLSCQTWAPSWTALPRNKQPPGLYLGITGLDRPPFRFVCLLAVATGVAAGDQALCCAGTLADGIGVILRARCIRPWGFSTAGVFYTRAIDDLAVTGLFQEQVDA